MIKKVAFIVDIILLILLFASCATTKEGRTYRKSIDGNWQLQTVVSEGIMGKVKAELFNEADFECFVGSTWNFNNNNSLGSYTIMQNANQCASVKRNLRWSIYEAKDQPQLFQFKRLDNNLKEIDEGSGGFRFTILQLDSRNMQLRSDITFEGKPAAFIYNFVKI